MKLLSFDYNGTPHVGVATSDGIVDLTRAMGRTHPDIKESHSLLAIIQSGLDIDTIGEQSLAALRGSGVLGDYLVANPSWLPPILRPPKILALALNYQEHIDESNLAFFNEPIVFAKYGCNMISHEARSSCRRSRRRSTRSTSWRSWSGATAATSCRRRLPATSSAGPS